MDEAIEHINRYSTKHSETIVTANEANAQKFLRLVDSAAVYWNASTRFTDGGEFGFGAEMGISTQKLHCRGPFALAELTSSKYQVIGTGQSSVVTCDQVLISEIRKSRRRSPATGSGSVVHPEGLSTRFIAYATTPAATTAAPSANELIPQTASLSLRTSANPSSSTGATPTAHAPINPSGNAERARQFRLANSQRDQRHELERQAQPVYKDVDRHQPFEAQVQAAGPADAPER